jgi:anti-sigma regulatory factor (Ser/Thr protein kinase)
MGPALAATSIRVDDQSQIGACRRTAGVLCESLGFKSAAEGKAALVATELATNLHRHAKNGMLLLNPVRGSRGAALQLLSIDSGPGMKDLATCMRDGFSTAGTAGKGFGAIVRTATEFDAYTSPAGTVVYAALFTADFVPAGAFDFAGISVPLRGQTACGDAWDINDSPPSRRLLVVDGLGHGPEAAEAAQAAVQAFAGKQPATLTELLNDLHSALVTTRGAAAAATEWSRDQVKFCGIGNIAGRIVSPQLSQRAINMVSQNGTLGHAKSRTSEFTYKWAPGDIMVVTSDGLSSHWDLAQYPGLFARKCAVMAGIIFRDAARGRDDATVCVLRNGEKAR